MAYPVRSMTKSRLLTGQFNGHLPPSVLSSTPGQIGGATVTLITPAARGWRALCAAAKKAGHTLKTNAPSSSYRTYDEQEDIFRARYVPWFTRHTSGEIRTKTWLGRTWWHQSGAVAAVPGQSNHGWASAVDTGEERDGDRWAEPLDNATLSWLIANEEKFGFSHEIQSEPWHLRWFSGDVIPAAVLAYEKTLKTPPETEDEDDMGTPQYLVIDDDGKWWVTGGIFKRYVNDRLEARILVNSKMAIADGTYSNGDPRPFRWPYLAIGDIRDVADLVK